MLALRGDMEDRGGMIAFNTPVRGARRRTAKWLVAFGGATRRVRVRCDRQLRRPRRASRGARALRIIRPSACRRSFSAKAIISPCQGKPAFTRLIYPVPIAGGLGVHVTLDLAGRMRFGPDVEWIERENYEVDPNAPTFFMSASAPTGRVCVTARSRPTMPASAEDRRARSAAEGLLDRHTGRARGARSRADVRH